MVLLLMDAKSKMRQHADERRSGPPEFVLGAYSTA
jgi:hypothetical protein